MSASTGGALTWQRLKTREAWMGTGAKSGEKKRERNSVGGWGRENNPHKPKNVVGFGKKGKNR